VVVVHSASKTPTSAQADTAGWRPTVGETVRIPWGIDEILGKVVEVYGSGLREYVVIELSPELSSLVVDEPTTVTHPIDDIRRAEGAA
jgi:hypothetical protein